MLEIRNQSDLTENHIKRKPLVISDFLLVGYGYLWLFTSRHLPMQKVLYFNNLFYINDLYMYMCLLRDKLGTKIGVKNAKKNKYRH